MLRARRTKRNAALAKEGGAIHVGSTRPFFRDDISNVSHQGHAAQAADQPPASDAPAGLAYSVLARIPETVPSSRIARGSTGDHPPSPTATYRVDPPQSTAPHTSKLGFATERLQSAISPARTPLASATDEAGSLPIPIWLAVRTWQFLQPHKGLLRMAAVFALITAAATSLMLMVGNRLQPNSDSSDATAVAADETPSIDRDEQAPDYRPAIPTEPAPEASTTFAVPTAEGPGGAVSRPAYDLATIAGGSLPRAAAPNEAPVRAVETSAEGHSQQSQATYAGAAAAPAYPTTSYPVLALPGSEQGALPQVRTTESAPAVARLRGYIEEAQTR